jgi:hypothetical protein
MNPPPHPPEAPTAPADGAGEASRLDGAASHRWLAVVLPPLVAVLMLGLTFLYWQSEERSARAKREQNFQVAADHIAYNLADRLATYEVVLRGQGVFRRVGAH